MMTALDRCMNALLELESAVGELSAFDASPQARAQAAADELFRLGPELSELERQYFAGELRAVEAKIKAFAARNPRTAFKLNMRIIN